MNFYTHIRLIGYTNVHIHVYMKAWCGHTLSNPQREEFTCGPCYVIFEHYIRVTQNDEASESQLIFFRFHIKHATLSAHSKHFSLVVYSESRTAPLCQHGSIMNTCGCSNPSRIRRRTWTPVQPQLQMTSLCSQWCRHTACRRSCEWSRNRGGVRSDSMWLIIPTLIHDYKSLLLF